jgi:iron complex transport system ATP-binding protein
MMNEIRLHQCSVIRDQRALLDDISVNFQPATFSVIMGENGAGKSTLLALIAADIRADHGTVTVNDACIDRMGARERAMHIAVLPQSSVTPFMFSAEEVVLLGRMPHSFGYPGKRDKDIALLAMQHTDSYDLRHRLFPTLSGGERGRVLLAKALAQIWDGISSGERGARYLLLDEPISAMDIAHQHESLKLMAALAKSEGIGVVTVLHDLNLTAQYAERVVLLKQGRLLADGRTADVLTPEMIAKGFGVSVRPLSLPAIGRNLFAVV